MTDKDWKLLEHIRTMNLGKSGTEVSVLLHLFDKREEEWQEKYEADCRSNFYQGVDVGYEDGYEIGFEDGYDTGIEESYDPGE